MEATATEERGRFDTLEGEAYGGCTLRVRRLREKARAAKRSVCLEKAAIMTEVFMKTEGEPMALRKAKTFRELCDRKTIFIDDDQLLVGQAGGRPLSAAFGPDMNGYMLSEELDTLSDRPQDPLLVDEAQKKLFREFIEPYWKGRNFWDVWNATAPEDLRQLNEVLIVLSLHGRDQSGHGMFTPGYDEVIGIGVNGLRKRVADRLATLDLTLPREYDKLNFLKALLIVCDGLERLADRYADLLEEKAQTEERPWRRAELERMAGICRHVPRNPARNFREALQALWFYHFAAMMEYAAGVYGPGRMDQYLYPYYRKDLEEKKMTKEEAQELLECLWIKFAEVTQPLDKDFARVVPGYPTFQVVACGGITKNGQNGVNDLSYMMIQATEDVRTTQPSLVVKYNKQKNPESFLLKAIELMALGTGHPQFYNDEAGIKCVMNYGIPFEDAYNWTPIGCKDVNIMGVMGNVRTPAIVNMAGGLELVLLNGVNRMTGQHLPVLKTGEVKDFKTFDEFKQAYKAQLKYLIAKGQELSLICESIVEQQSPALLTSLTFEECVENGKSCMAGGAKYSPGGEIVLTGLADIVNSLAFIRQLVYEEKKLTWDGLLAALENDFAGHEEIREMCLAAPKYGNDIPEIDQLATEMSQFVGDEVKKYVGLHGEKRIAVTPAAAGHLFTGIVVGALPSGRKAWQPLADGISPMQGTDVMGPTAVLNSASKVCSEVYCAPLLNMKIDPVFFQSPRGIENFAGFMKTWHDLGIYEIQFNVVSPDILREAQRHPEKYRGLTVRVSGYCAYFVDLYKEIQDELISRTTFQQMQ
jgi:choline trimethylamine-lyase